MPEVHVFQLEDLHAAPGQGSFAFAFFIRANDWAEIGKLDSAIADYNAALAINPGLATAYVNRGVVWERKGDFARAIADYEAALRINPQDAKAINNHALALQAWNDGRN